MGSKGVDEDEKQNDRKLLAEIIKRTKKMEKELDDILSDDKSPRDPKT